MRLKKNIKCNLKLRSFGFWVRFGMILLKSKRNWCDFKQCFWFSLCKLYKTSQLPAPDTIIQWLKPNPGVSSWESNSRIDLKIETLVVVWWLLVCFFLLFFYFHQQVQCPPCLWDSKPITNWAAACYISWSLLGLFSLQSHALCAAAARLGGHKYINDPCVSSISTEGHTSLSGLITEFTPKCPCLL